MSFGPKLLISPELGVHCFATNCLHMCLLCMECNIRIRAQQFPETDFPLPTPLLENLAEALFQTRNVPPADRGWTKSEIKLDSCFLPSRMLFNVPFNHWYKQLGESVLILKPPAVILYIVQCFLRASWMLGISIQSVCSLPTCNYQQLKWILPTDTSSLQTFCVCSVLLTLASKK